MAEPQNIPFRPLSIGMRRDISSVRPMNDGFYDVKNLIADQKGLTIRPCLSERQHGLAISYTSPQAESIGVTESTLHIVNIEGLQYSGNAVYLYLANSRASRESVEGSVSGSVNEGVAVDSGASNGSSVGTSVTLTGATLETDKIKIGDYVYLDGDGYRIASVDSETTCTIFATPASDYTNVDWSVLRKWYVVDGYWDYAVGVQGYVYCTDNNHAIWRWDSNSHSTFATRDHRATFTSCRAVGFFKNRVFAGNVYEGSTRHTRRIRWSTPTDSSDFDNDGADIQWLDLPDFAGEILRLLPLGDLLVCYLSDGIAIGRPTNIRGNALPVSFEKLDTGTVGIVDQHAVVPWRDSHIFVGQDNIYMLSVGQGLQTIGDAVFEDFLQPASDFTFIRTVHDPERKRILIFYTAEATPYFKNALSWNYETNSWSRDTYSGVGLEAPSTVTYEGESRVYAVGPSASTAHDVLRITDTAVSDANGAPEFLIETGDIDFDLPDTNKTWMSLRIDTVQNVDLDFTVKASDDYGTAWTTLGTLTVPAGEVEGYLNFLYTESAVRFQISSSTTPESQYTILELVARVANRGIEVDY